MKAIEIKGLSKAYRDMLAVDCLTLSVEEGELFALLGVNGAGKTTTIKMLTGILTPDAGDALLLGHSIRSEEEKAKALLAVAPQKTAVAPNLTVRENLALMCGLSDLPRAVTEERVRKTLEEFSLGAVASKRAAKLSGGWQRRLSLAMALITAPRILFLDEPTIGLDVIARSELWETIRALKGRMTVVLTTHYMEEAEALADRVAIMKEGRLLAIGSVPELKERTQKERFEDAFVSIVRGETV